jgi:SAM-dependent methyltransferase
MPARSSRTASISSVSIQEERNKNFWGGIGADYSQGWAGPGQQIISEKERSFVTQHMPAVPGQSVADIGIGNGRILETLLSKDLVEAVYGVDIAPQMVELCKARLSGHRKLKGLFVCDIGRDPLPLPRDLQFISAIRVLKYSQNWWDIVAGSLIPHLAPGGVLVFSMANRNSSKRFSRPYDVDYFTTTPKELRQRLASANSELLTISGFSKVPDFFYRTFKTALLTEALIASERFLSWAVGEAHLARELFVAARRVG